MIKLFIFSFLTILLFNGCNKEKVKLLDNEYLNTQLGTIVEQKLITHIIEEEEVKISKPKLLNQSVSEKKQYFQNILVPIITEVYLTLENQYQNVKKNISLGKNQEFIEKLKTEYKASNEEELLAALKPHPISIVLAQAAIESAWLTSRFTIEANNIFGVWSFNQEEPRIEAESSRGDKRIYLKKYKNLKSAVYDYYKNLGRSWAFDSFRKLRLHTNDPYALVEHLGHFSEKREIYTNTLKRMIEYNGFEKYDIK